MLPRFTVKHFMTRDPYTVGRDQLLSVAHRIMRSHRVRHLPVLDEGKLVGLVSESDLVLIERMGGVDPDRIKVEEVMTPDPYLVGPEMHLAEVASEMSENRYSSAAVMEGGQLIGIFTTIDALRALLLVLEGGPRRRRHDSAAI